VDNKKKLLLSVIFLVLAGGFFGYKYFSVRSAKKIEIQGEVTGNNNQKDNVPADSNAESKGSTSETVSDMPRSNLNEEPNSKEAQKINIINKFVSWGYEKAVARKIDTVIIHSTYNALGGDPFSLEKILDIYKSYGVSPHYIIDRSGKIYRLVADENIAYHAGEGKVPDGRTSVNNFSIGIEIINSKTEKPTSEQYSALSSLIKNLQSKYSIKYILGHNQIAPGRKDDPWNFDWSKVNK